MFMLKIYQASYALRQQNLSSQDVLGVASCCDDWRMMLSFYVYFCLSIWWWVSLSLRRALQKQGRKEKLNQKSHRHDQDKDKPENK